MTFYSSRRQFLGIAAAAVPAARRVIAETEPTSAPLSFPLVDFHVHLNPSFSLADAVALSRKTHVKFGIAQHAGIKENNYPSIITNDGELRAWVAKLAGEPVYKGLQAEWTDWMGCFSKEALGEIDYVLSDAMTFPGANGRRIKMWEPGFDPGDAREFMERYVRWNVEVIEKEPLDIFSHPTWLPAPLDKRADELWTEERTKPIIQALRRTGTAVEIDSDFLIPSVAFLRMAKDARLKFSFGSNSGSGPARSIDFCIERAKAVGLTAANMFVPARGNRKPFARRKFF
jgi:histidinol phosphatase-like PHP family hydrolase